MNQLRDVGAEPIVLSVIDAAPLIPFIPNVVSVSPEIDVSGIELLKAPSQGYRVTVRNVALQAVALFGVQSYRGENRAVSRVVRGDRGLPALWHPVRRVRSTCPSAAAVATPATPGSRSTSSRSTKCCGKTGRRSARHAATPLNFVTATDGGRRIQFERALQVLRAAQTQPGLNATDLLSQIRRGLEGIPESDDERLEAARQMMRVTRALVLNDLAAFQLSQPRTAADVRVWVEETIAKYDAWVRRLAA